MSERAGRGLFECPVDDCDATVIGLHGDLIAHILDEHPLEDLYVDENGESVVERIKKEQKEALKKDIRERLVVDDERETVADTERSQGGESDAE